MVKVLSGIISFGKGCGRSETPGVYVNVWHQDYRNWMMRVITNTLEKKDGGLNGLTLVEDDGSINDHAYEILEIIHPWIANFGGKQFLTEQGALETNEYDNQGYENDTNAAQSRYQQLLAEYRKKMQLARQRQQQAMIRQFMNCRSQGQFKVSRVPTNRISSIPHGGLLGCYMHQSYCPKINPNNQYQCKAVGPRSAMERLDYRKYLNCVKCWSRNTVQNQATNCRQYCN